MRNMRITLGFMMVFLSLLLPVVHAVPNLIGYHGVLNDKDGEPISSTVTMTFSIYDVPADGTALWTETQTVPVSNGLFNVELGAITPLPTSLFDQDTLYLGIQLASDEEMTPRQRITSGSYTYRAASADIASGLDHPIVPVGAIVAWVKTMTGVPALPDGWVECNGQTIDDLDSPLHGQAVPDLDGGRFLRGSTTSGGSGGSDTHRHGEGSSASGQFNTTGGYNKYTDYQNHLPPYYNVVWIMKIK